MNLLDIAIAKKMGGGGDEPTGTKEINITQNGVTIEDVKSYASAKITTNVPNSYAAGDEGKVVSNGALVAQTSKNVTSNGTVDTTTNNQVVVNVPPGTPTIQSLSVTQNGTYTAPSGVDGYSPVTVNVSGGGGASNVVTGTFTTDSASGAYALEIPYTGNGYPIALMIYVDGGAYNDTASGNTDWYNSLNRYDVGWYSMTKARTTTAPTYVGQKGEDNYGTVAIIYKNSTTNATNYTRTSAMDTVAYVSSTFTAGPSTECARFRANGTTLRYYVGGRTSSTIGFAQNTKFVYIAVYSS